MEHDRCKLCGGPLKAMKSRRRGYGKRCWENRFPQLELFRTIEPKKPKLGANDVQDVPASPRSPD